MSKKNKARKRNEEASEMSMMARMRLAKARYDLDQLKAYLRQETIPFLKNIMKHAAQNEYDMGHRKRIDSFNNAAQELRECIQGLKKYIRGIK